MEMLQFLVKQKWKIFFIGLYVMFQIIPIVSLDKIYYRPRERDFFLDCTRLEGSKTLVSRRNPNDLNSVEKQIGDISISLKLQGEKEIVLVDDVVFSGSVLKTITELFRENGIRVVGIRASISTEEAYDKFNKVLISDQLAEIRLHKRGPKPEHGNLEYIFKQNSFSYKYEFLY